MVWWDIVRFDSYNINIELFNKLKECFKTIKNYKGSTAFSCPTFDELELFNILKSELIEELPAVVKFNLSFIEIFINRFTFVSKDFEQRITIACAPDPRKEMEKRKKTVEQADHAIFDELID